MNKITIAIDGYSACGKSTTAKMVAKRLKYVHIDTGAMYRAVALFLLRNELPTDYISEALREKLKDIQIGFKVNAETGESRTYLDGQDVEDDIRSLEVSSVVSEVAAIREVREAMVRRQQVMGLEKGVVMDGRDIGTVVFPNAELKIFMTASLERRVERRMADLVERGIEMSEDDVRENVLHRDHIDTTRKESPLRQAEDAILLDNSNITIEEQVQFVVELAEQKMLEAGTTVK